MGLQRGFTLTELLVALAISVILMLGAGQLFLSTLTTFRQVDALGRQQESLVYLTTILSESLRRHGAIASNGEPLFHLQCLQRTLTCRCTVQDMQQAQPLISFDTSGNTACKRDEPLGLSAGSSRGISVVSLPLGPQGRDVHFYVTLRGSVLTSSYQ